MTSRNTRPNPNLFQRHKYGMRRSAALGAVLLGGLAASKGVSELGEMQRSDALKQSLKQPEAQLKQDLKNGDIDISEVTALRVTKNESTYDFAAGITKDKTETPEASEILSEQIGNIAENGEVIALPKDMIDQNAAQQIQKQAENYDHTHNVDASG